jgi:hypothetical protein
MIVRIMSRGKSFKGLSTYLTHDPDAQTQERVAWTHTINLANDHVPSAVDEMYWTAQNAELLKQEAGIRAGGRATENSLKHLSLNWAPDEQPTRDHMIATTEEFLRHMKWQEHQALLVSHNDKSHAHVHVMLNVIHPETGLHLDDNFERRRAQAWALEYERENDRIYCEQRLKSPAERENAPPRNVWLAFQKSERGFANSENRLRENEPVTPEKPKNIENSEWEILKEYQRNERIEFFNSGNSAFKEVRKSIYRETRETFRDCWSAYYEGLRAGRPSLELAAFKERIITEQDAALTGKQDEACKALRASRDEHYRAILDSQREARAELRRRQKAGLDNAPFLSQLGDKKIHTDLTDGFRDAAHEITGANNRGRSLFDRASDAYIELATHSHASRADGVGLRVSLSVGSLFDALFRDLTNLGSAPQTHERVDPDLFQAAADESQKRQQREREEDEARAKQKSVSWG